MIPRIAEMINCGMVCYLNPETLDLAEIPHGVMEGTSDAEDSLFRNDLKMTWGKWSNVIVIEPLQSFDSFRIMESFADEVIVDPSFKSALFSSLRQGKPFRHFKYLIDDSPDRQQWFDYKQSMLETYVERILKTETNDTEGF